MGLWISVIALSNFFAVYAAGIGLDLSAVTVDLTGAFDRATQAASDGLYALGLQGSQVDQILQDLDTTLADIQETFPFQYFPLPMVGCKLELPLPLIVINKVVFSAGLVNDSIVRSVAGVVGYSIPQPVVPDTMVDLGGDTAQVSADIGLSAFKLTATVASHFDLLIAGIELAAGLDFIKGGIDPQVSVTAPGHQTEVDAALDVLHLDDLGWTTFAASVSGQIELGPPFLRLVAKGAYQVPMIEGIGWWGIRSGALSASVGLVIRF